MTKKAKRKRYWKGWCPRDRKGTLWVNWMETTKKRAIDELNYKYTGWDVDGMTVVRVLVKEL